MKGENWIAHERHITPAQRLRNNGGRNSPISRTCGLIQSPARRTILALGVTQIVGYGTL